MPPDFSGDGNHSAEGGFAQGVSEATFPLLQAPPSLLFPAVGFSQDQQDQAQNEHRVGNVRERGEQPTGSGMGGKG